ncbi:MAG: helix-turn-helix transcriptional regulator [bacterium]|nr:helix-turn-helix transcriptional regulator [bacterium]
MKKRHFQLALQMGRRIKETRLQLRLNQKEFSGRMGMSDNHLSALEAGKSAPGFYFIYQAVKHYDLNPLFLLFGKKPMFLGQEEQEKEQPPAREPQAREFGESTSQVGEMLDLFQQSPMVKFALLGFYSKFIIENKGLIEEDIKRHQKRTGTESD